MLRRVFAHDALAHPSQGPLLGRRNVSKSFVPQIFQMNCVRLVSGDARRPSHALISYLVWISTYSKKFESFFVRATIKSTPFRLNHCQLSIGPYPSQAGPAWWFCRSLEPKFTMFRIINFLFIINWVQWKSLQAVLLPNVFHTNVVRTDQNLIILFD